MTRDEVKIGAFVRTKFHVWRGAGLTNEPAAGVITAAHFDEPMSNELDPTSLGLIHADSVTIEGPLSSNCGRNSERWFLSQLVVIKNYNSPVMKAIRGEK